MQKQVEQTVKEIIEKYTINNYFIDETQINLSYLFIFQQYLDQKNQYQKQVQLLLLKSKLHFKSKLLLIKNSEILTIEKPYLSCLYDFQQTIFLQQFDEFLKQKINDQDIYNTILHEFLNCCYYTGRQYILNYILMHIQDFNLNHQFIENSLLKILDSKKYFTIYKYIEVLTGNVYMNKGGDLQQDNLEIRMTKMSIEIVRQFSKEHQNLQYHVNEVNIYQWLLSKAFQKLDYQFEAKVIRNIENSYVFTVLFKLYDNKQMVLDNASKSIETYLIYILKNNLNNNIDLQQALKIEIDKCSYIKNNVFIQYLQWKQLLQQNNLEQAKYELGQKYFNQYIYFLYDAILSLQQVKLQTKEDLFYIIDQYLQLNDGESAFINCYHYLTDNQTYYYALVQQELINLVEMWKQNSYELIMNNMKDLIDILIERLLRLIKKQTMIPIFTINYYQQNICIKLMEILVSKFKYQIDTKIIMDLYLLLNNKLQVAQSPQVNILAVICLTFQNYDIKVVNDICEKILEYRYQQSARVQIDSMTILGYALTQFYDQLQQSTKDKIIDYIGQQVLSTVIVVAQNCISVCQHLISQQIPLNFGIILSKIQQYRIEKLTLFQQCQRSMEDLIFKLNYKETISAKHRPQMQQFSKVTQDIKIGDDEIVEQQENENKQEDTKQQKQFSQTKISVQQFNVENIDNNMILILSLLQNPINIAGIVRTSEIFNCQKILINNKEELLQNQQFITQCVNSEKHIQLEQLQISELNKAIQQYKQQNYSIVALEQSVNSVMLNEFQWPNKSVLILGNERTGIPNALLQMCDYVVEIPQFGQTRSLNVHVSASLAVWEYAKQNTKKQ